MKPPPDPTLDRIIKRARKIVRECDQAATDGESWNAAHPDETPLNVSDFRAWSAAAQQALTDALNVKRRIEREARKPGR